MAKNPRVSIIIPTFNSEKTLAFCLQSIKNQTYPNIETIIVDSFSQDKTIQIAKQFHTKILLTKTERSAARNLGAKVSKGVFVFFVDSDMELSPMVVEECVKLSRRKKADAVIIPEESVGKGFVAQCRSMEKEMRVGGKFSEAPRFFRKNVFNHVGGFDEKLVSGEDFDLGRRIELAGYKIKRCQAKIRHHEEEMSMKKLILKTYYYGKTFPSYLRKNPSLSIKTSCPIHIAKNLKMLRKKPKTFAQLLFIKLAQYITYITSFLFNLPNTQFSQQTHRPKTNPSSEHNEKAQFTTRNFSEPETKRIMLTLKYVSSNPILDAGCGTGWLMTFLAGKGFNVIGLDISRNSLKVAQKSFSKNKVVLGSVNRIPFPNNFFGTVILFDVLEHVKEISTVLSEVRRVTKKGGHILISVPNAIGSYSLINDILKERMLMKIFPFVKLTQYETLKHHHQHIHHFSWWKKVLEKSGFSLITSCNIEIFTPLLSIFLRGKSLQHMAYYDVQKADDFPRFLASEWFMPCIKK